MSNREIFGKIYKSQIWGDGSEENPLSGSGSNPANAKPFVNFVKELIPREKVKSVLEVGHGDWAMWKDYRFPNLMYMGIDVAAGLSEQIQEIYADDFHAFQYLDFCETELPPADLLVTKDVLQHLPNDEIIRLLGSLAPYKSVVICNDIYVSGTLLFETREFLQLRHRFRKFLKGESPFFSVTRFNNSNIAGGQFRGIDLEKKPFKVALNGMTLKESFDYDGPKRRGIKKRVYHFVKN
jgi:hypothetical protein